MPIPGKTKTKRSKKSGPATWQLQTAKAQLSEVIRRARTAGPQVVTKQGKEEVVIVAVEEFRSLTRRARHPESLVEFFARSPLAEARIDFERKPDYGRKIDL